MPGSSDCFLHRAVLTKISTHKNNCYFFLGIAINYFYAGKIGVPPNICLRKNNTYFSMGIFPAWRSTNKINCYFFLGIGRNHYMGKKDWCPMPEKKITIIFFHEDIVMVSNSESFLHRAVPTKLTVIFCGALL